MKPRSVCSATAFSPRTLTLALGCLLTAAGAQAQDKIRIGFITDMSGLYADVDGKGGALAVQMAVDDFGGKLLGKPVEVLTADHQNKADIAASKAREWFDTQGMNMLIGGTTSSAAPILCTMPMTPWRWPRARARQWWSWVARAGSF